MTSKNLDSDGSVACDVDRSIELYLTYFFFTQRLRTCITATTSYRIMIILLVQHVVMKDKLHLNNNNNVAYNVAASIKLKLNINDIVIIPIIAIICKITMILK